MFRGREVSHPELGMKILDDLAEQVSSVAKVEAAPKLDGRNMVMVLAPDRRARQATRRATDLAQGTECLRHRARSTEPGALRQAAPEPAGCCARWTWHSGRSCRPSPRPLTPLRLAPLRLAPLLVAAPPKGAGTGRVGQWCCPSAAPTGDGGGVSPRRPPHTRRQPGQPQQLASATLCLRYPIGWFRRAISADCEGLRSWANRTRPSRPREARADAKAKNRQGRG